MSNFVSIDFPIRRTPPKPLQQRSEELKKKLERFESQYKPPVYTGPEDRVDHSPQLEAATRSILTTGATTAYGALNGLLLGGALTMCGASASTATAAMTLCAGVGFLVGISLNRP